jgi:DNA-binding MarR family transcriptional regulator
VKRGLTQARAAVIWQLHELGPVTQRTLSEALRVSPRNVTGLLDALEAGGYAPRGRHPTDRWATLISLTDQGAAAAARRHADYQMGAPGCCLVASRPPTSPPSLASLTTCSAGSAGRLRLAGGAGRQRAIDVWVRLVHPAAWMVACMARMSS